jgi:hypothetical protein
MNKRLMTLSAIVVLAALTRLAPHPPNVTPIAAMALFGGAYFRGRKIAFLLPLAAMLLSDLVLGVRGLRHGIDEIPAGRLSVHAVNGCDWPKYPN